MTIIPSGMLMRWSTRARRGSLSKLHTLLEFRDLCKSEGYKDENCLMQAYKEAAEAMMIAPETLRDDMGKIRNYPARRLMYWLSNGLSFDHLETANRLAEVAKKTPEKLLNEALDPGNATGQPMTVNELTLFAIGEVPQSSRPHVYRLVVLFDKLRKFPTQYKWDELKAMRFTEWLELGKEFLV